MIIAEAEICNWNLSCRRVFDSGQMKRRFLRGDQWVGLYHWFPRSLTLQLWVLVFYAEVVFSYILSPLPLRIWRFIGSVCKVRTQDPENFGWRGQVFGICLAWSLLRMLPNKMSSRGLHARNHLLETLSFVPALSGCYVSSLLFCNLISSCLRVYFLWILCSQSSALRNSYLSTSGEAAVGRGNRL